MLRNYRFPFTFDPALLLDDLKCVQQGAWEKHFNVAHYEGVWTGIALRSIAGMTTNIIPFSGNGVHYQDTPLLDECPYFQRVIETFKCPFKSISLLRLEAGSVIKEHVHKGLESHHGEIRIHIPLVNY